MLSRKQINSHVNRDRTQQCRVSIYLVGRVSRLGNAYQTDVNFASGVEDQLSHVTAVPDGKKRKTRKRAVIERKRIPDTTLAPRYTVLDAVQSRHAPRVSGEIGDRVCWRTTAWSSCSAWKLALRDPG